jgi:hypothetical protein
MQDKLVGGDPEFKAVEKNLSLEPISSVMKLSAPAIQLGSRSQYTNVREFTLFEKGRIIGQKF